MFGVKKWKKCRKKCGLNIIFANFGGFLEENIFEIVTQK